MKTRLILALFAAFALVSEAAVTYSYDTAGRLVTVDYGNGATITYTYDAAGNVLTKTVTAASKTTPKAPPEGKDSKAKPAKK